MKRILNFVRRRQLDRELAQEVESHLEEKVADLMERKNVKKTAMAKRMQTSRAALDRLLDPSNTSVTLATLNRAAKALGRKLKIELVPA